MHNHHEAPRRGHAHLGSNRGTRRHCSLPVMAVAAVATLALAILPSLPALADGGGVGAPSGSTPLGNGFFEHHGEAQASGLHASRGHCTQAYRAAERMRWTSAGKQIKDRENREHHEGLDRSRLVHGRRAL